MWEAKVQNLQYIVLRKDVLDADGAVYFETRKILTLLLVLIILSLYNKHLTHFNS